jgi:hypothetical protein
MRKPMEFPTEWTMPDPAEDRDISLDEQAAAPPPAQAAAPVKDAVPIVAGVASGNRIRCSAR